MIPLPLAGDAAGRERRLRELLAADPAARDRVEARVREAFVSGSRLLAGLRDDAEGRAEEQRLLEMVRNDERLEAALPRWMHVFGGARHAPLAGGAPAELVPGRLQLLYDWVDSEAGRELPPAAAGALVMARTMEIRPVAEGNGRLARLAARHVMRRTGSLGYVLGPEIRDALKEAIAAAQAFDTRPLVALLEDGAGRAVAIAADELAAKG